MTQRVRGVVRRVRDFAGPGARVPEKSLVWAGKWNEARTVFFRKTKSLIGLDVGSSAVKAVELRQTMGGYRVVAGGTEPVPPGSIVDGAIVDGAIVAEVIRHVLDRNRIKSQGVVASLSGNAVIVKKVTLPLMSEDELAESIV